MASRSLLLALACLLASPASAAPVGANATLSIFMPGLGAATVVGSGSVDVAGGAITVPAGLVGVAGPLIVPVTGTTAVDSLSLAGIANLAGAFSVGGVTAQTPSEICPGGRAPAGPAGGSACNVGGGLGGVMGLTGTIFVNVIPNIVVIPVALDVLQLGQGGVLNAPFSVDAAAWTTGTALLNTGVNTHGYTGYSAFAGGGTFQLVSPLYVMACGNILPIISTLTLELVPEPAAWVSLWLGVLGIVFLTRRR
jgi:hypothetical protein